MPVSVKDTIKNQIKGHSNAIYAWPKTSYNEFSKRMFMCFMKVFFLHIFITIAVDVFFGGNGQAIKIMEVCIPVYTTIFAAVIVKGGVENVFKGLKTTSTEDSEDSDDDSSG